MRGLQVAVAVLVATTYAAGLRGQEAPRSLGVPALDRAEGVPVIPWRDAAAYEGREVYVVGKVVRARQTKTMAFLNFDLDYRRTLTVAIRAEHWRNFPQPPHEMYAGKTIRVRGWVTRYRNQLEVLVSRPEQIEVVSEDTTPPPPRAVATRPAAPDGVLTLATFNVENLFDAYDDPYRNDEGTPPKPRAALEAVARTIRAVDADVLALEEIENRGCLEQFNRVLLPDMGYAHVVLFEGNDVRGIDVALLSRLPVGPVTSYRHLRFGAGADQTTGFQRDLLRARIEPPGAPAFDVFVVHLKSKEGGDEDTGIDIRMGEARTVRGILDGILSEDPQARFVVCGDFNDTFESRPLQVLLGSGPTRLRSFHEEAPPDVRVTYNRPPHRSMIDFVLCSPAMAAQYVPGSFRILPGTQESLGSDHNPVVVKFRLR